MVELASSAGSRFQSFAREWIPAVGSMELPQARAVFMGFVDPSVSAKVAITPDLHEAVAAQVAAHAEKDAETRARIQEICGLDLLPAQRQIVAGVVAMLGDADTVLAGLSLIHDDASPPIPFHLVRAVDSVILDRRPYGHNQIGMNPDSDLALGDIFNALPHSRHERHPADRQNLIDLLRGHARSRDGLGVNVF